MSKKLIRSLTAESKKAGGAHLTLEARHQAYADFGAAMFRANVQIHSADQIGGRELRVYAVHLNAQVKSVGTRQNRMAAIRVALTQVGKSSLAKDPNYSNAALGLGKRCRDGTKTAASPEVVSTIKSKVEKLDRGWIATVMELEETVGLRRSEAVCVPAFRLRQWLKQLPKEGRVYVVDGTKGGRERFVEPPHPARALEAIKSALAAAEANGGYLAQYDDGSPAKSKKSALGMYSSCLNRLGFQGHALRYSFTRAVRKRGLEEGLTENQALAAASRNLGHGEGRGRYVKQVYLK
ncbi:MAG: hypothetical protein EPN60_17270 [Nevskiaceae bacterium]|nr:MAG: hypothetical protein EPO48_11105 [Nevskiaceae bacterium]TAM22263.1 MAG: hypothetical protein EPN60_17270 [Nevskiaceae bacterium]